MAFIIISIRDIYYIIYGRQKRTLHLYVVTATNLVFKVQTQSQRRDVAQHVQAGGGGGGKRCGR